MNLLLEAQSRQTEYTAIKQNCCFSEFYRGPVDISVIIPVHGRTEFNNIAALHFLEAFLYRESIFSVSITFVEHSEQPQHKELCTRTNYIHIPQNKQPFNKCLCHNIGALCGNKAKYFLFHDIDILVPENFFQKIELNINHISNLQYPASSIHHPALQTFTDSRLLYCNENLSADIMNRKLNINDLDDKSSGLSSGATGAEGGSILISRDLFFDIGGYDADFFTEYSFEDCMFYQKADLMAGVHHADNPPIELFHLFHQPSYNSTVKESDREAYYAFRELSADDKKKFMEIKSQQLKKHIYDYKKP